MTDITEVARDKVSSVLSRVEKGELSTGTRSRKLLGLPVRRVIPQDIHSLLDYGNGATGMAAAAFAETTRARIANLVLSAATIGVSALTDYKLSFAKIVPIEVHEAIDYVYGASNVVSPFALGYFRKDRAVSMLQIGLGLGTIVASMFTDYRAFSRSRTSTSTSRARSQTQSHPQKKRKKS